MIKKLEYKEKHKYFFSIYANGSSAFLLGKTLKKINPRIRFSENVELFLNSGIVRDNYIFNELKQRL